MGYLGVQFAKALGLRVIGVDAREEGLEVTREAGADVVVAAREGVAKAVEEIKKVTHGKGVPVTINVSDADKGECELCGYRDAWYCCANCSGISSLPPMLYELTGLPVADDE